MVVLPRCASTRPNHRLCLQYLVGVFAVSTYSVLYASPLCPPGSHTIAPLTYQSPLNAYEAWRDEPVGSWREAVNKVGNIGGWRAYAREAQTSDSQTAPAPNQWPESASPAAKKNPASESDCVNHGGKP